MALKCKSHRHSFPYPPLLSERRAFGREHQQRKPFR